MIFWNINVQNILTLLLRSRFARISLFRIISRSRSRFFALKRCSRVYQYFSIPIEISWSSRPTFGKCWDFLNCRDLLFVSVEIKSLDRDTIETNRDKSLEKTFNSFCPQNKQGFKKNTHFFQIIQFGNNFRPQPLRLEIYLIRLSLAEHGVAEMESKKFSRTTSIGKQLKKVSR
jgi:hypothetical protein